MKEKLHHALSSEQLKFLFERAEYSAGEFIAIGDLYSLPQT